MYRIIIVLTALFIGLTNISIAQNQKNVKPLAAYLYEGKWHFIDHNGNEFLAPKSYESVGGYSEGLLLVKKIYDRETKWCYMNTDGEIEIVAPTDEAFEFHEGMAIVANKQGDNSSLYGFINRNGEQVVPVQYMDAVNFSEGKAYIMNRKERGYIDTTGKFVIPLGDSLVGYIFSEGLAAVSDKRYRCGYINHNGEQVIARQFDEPRPFNEGLAPVSIYSEFGYITKNGDSFIELKYDDAREFSEDRAFVGQRNTNYSVSWAVITREDSMLTDYIFDQVHPYNEGAACVRQGEKWFFIDKNGKKVFDQEFDLAGSFRNGLAWAQINKQNKYGFINHKGEFVIEIPKPEKVKDLRLNEEME